VLTGAWLSTKLFVRNRGQLGTLQFGVRLSACGIRFVGGLGLALGLAPPFAAGLRLLGRALV
jgi:hypothetical protein